ncbi:MAG TPA: hypothetical protein VGI06_12390 [Acidimicrobiales bacterium]
MNVWPEALGDAALEVAGATNDFFVRALRVDNRDELLLSVVSDRGPAAYPEVGAAVAEHLKQKFGVRIMVEAVAPGSLDALTGADVSPKLKRFRDERPGP